MQSNSIPGQPFVTSYIAQSNSIPGSWGVASHSKVPVCKTVNSIKASLFPAPPKQEGHSPDAPVVDISTVIVAPTSQIGIADEHKFPPVAAGGADEIHNSKPPSVPPLEATAIHT